MTTTPTPKSPPAWFTAIIGSGLAKLYALSLEGNPAMDAVGGTRQVWVEDLWARLAPSEPSPERDRARLEAAFRALRLSVTRWPTPAQYLQHLAPPPAPRRPPMLSVDGLSREERARRIVENERRRAEVGLRPMSELLDAERAEQPR